MTNIITRNMCREMLSAAIDDMERGMTKCYHEILTDLLAKETFNFGRTAYVNSGSLSRKLQNEPSRKRFTNVSSVYILDRLV